jgi:transposase
MARPKKYPDELVARGVRLALQSARPIARIGADLGMPPRRSGSVCVRRRPMVALRADLPTTAEREEIRKLRAENFELRRE